MASNNMTNPEPIVPQANAQGDRQSLESIFGGSSNPSGRPSLDSILGLDKPKEEPLDIGGTIKATEGGLAEGMGGTLALPLINWAGRKIIEHLPDDTVVAGLTKQQMLDNLDRSPDLQKQFESQFERDKHPNAYTAGEVTGVLATLAPSITKGVVKLAETETGKKVLDAAGNIAKAPFTLTRDLAVGTARKAKDIVGLGDNATAEIMSSPEVHPFVAASPEKAKLVADAIKQGYEPRDIKFLTTLSDADKPALKEMTDLAATGEGDLRAAYAGKRPADVVGDSVLEPLKKIQAINAEAGAAVDSTARALTKQRVDASNVFKKTMKELKNAGVTVMENGELDFDSSIFKKTPSLVAQLRNAFSDLPTGQTNAYDLHKFKKGLDVLIKHGTAGEGIKGQAQRIMQAARATADDVLDTTFADYNKANTDFKTTRDLLDKAHDVMGKETDFLSGNANMRVGQAMRQLFNNSTKRQDMFNFLTDLTKTATEHGVAVEKNPVDQALYAQLLEGIYGTPAITGLQGEVGKAITKAAGKLAEFKVSPVTATAKIGAEMIERFKNISPEEKKRVLNLFLELPK